MMGDKIQAKKIAKENGLPIIEGSDGGVKDIEEAKNFVKKLVFQFYQSIRWWWWKGNENCS